MVSYLSTEKTACNLIQLKTYSLMQLLLKKNLKILLFNGFQVRLRTIFDHIGLGKFDRNLDVA